MQSRKKISITTHGTNSKTPRTHFPSFSRVAYTNGHGWTSGMRSSCCQRNMSVWGRRYGRNDLHEIVPAINKRALHVMCWAFPFIVQ